MKKIFTVVLLATALMAATTQAKAQTKFGYISLQDVIAAMPEAKKADTTLVQYRDALIASAKDKETDLNERITKFNTDSAKLAPAVKDVKRKELQEKLQDLQGEEQRIQEALQRKQEELSGPIQKKALDAVAVVAKENGYTYVFPKEALIVSPPTDDILALVKKKLGLK